MIWDISYYNTFLLISVPTPFILMTTKAIIILTTWFFTYIVMINSILLIFIDLGAVLNYNQLSAYCYNKNHTAISSVRPWKNRALFYFIGLFNEQCYRKYHHIIQIWCTQQKEKKIDNYKLHKFSRRIQAVCSLGLSGKSPWVDRYRTNEVKINNFWRLELVRSDCMRNFTSVKTVNEIWVH